LRIDYPLTERASEDYDAKREQSIAEHVPLREEG
jgi:hypothetical protein